MIPSLSEIARNLLAEMDSYILTAIIFLPILGALWLLTVPARDNRGGSVVRWGAFAISFADFMLSLLLAAQFDTSADSPAFQFAAQVTWIPDWGVSYKVGVDGLSLSLVLLTNLLTALAILSSFTAIKDREREYYIFILLLQSGILGTFLALDLFLFYAFWELMLIPLYFLIGMWGSENRIYATMKFVLYTLAGSLLMLIGIIYIYYKGHIANGGVWTSDYSVLAEANLNLGRVAEMLLFLAFLLAFAIKVPIFPLHTWLPDAHTEAPTAGSVILAGILLKTGLYGVLRFCFPLFPQATVKAAPVLGWLGAVGIVYGALTAFAQKDMKRLVAYSSISHMGFALVGIFALQDEAARGAMLQMINHGISTGGLFLCVGMIYERRHTRLMSEFGGLANNLKRCAALTVIIALSSLGLPGLNGFVGEILIVLGVVRAKQIIWAVFAVTGVVLSAVYLLTMIQRTFYGPLDKPANRQLRDLSFREVAAILPLVCIAFWIGFYPKPFLRVFERNAAEVVRIADKVKSGTKERSVIIVRTPAGTPKRFHHRDAEAQRKALLCVSAPLYYYSVNSFFFAKIFWRVLGKSLS
ncbi:NADH-quinone oxidoreductase subunit M [Candidatus Sumerlaeota bacterium]|nr:NADH-quinone oxidoreductase subunit M [Candidatus Sumerlaeota bacterium]